MAAKKSIDQRIEEAKMELGLLEDDLEVEKAYDLMPTGGQASEHYSYTESKMYIHNLAVQNWLRAIVKHINVRWKLGNTLNVAIVDVPKFRYVRNGKDMTRDREEYNVLVRLMLTFINKRLPIKIDIDSVKFIEKKNEPIRREV